MAVHIPELRKQKQTELEASLTYKVPRQKGLETLSPKKETKKGRKGEKERRASMQSVLSVIFIVGGAQKRTTFKLLESVLFPSSHHVGLVK